MGSDLAQKELRVSSNQGGPSRAARFGEVSGVYSRKPPAHIHARKPCRPQLQQGNVQAASCSAALPSAIATLFSSLGPEEALPVHVRLLVPAASAPQKRIDSSEQNRLCESAVSIKAEVVDHIAVRPPLTGTPGKIKPDPDIKQEPSDGPQVNSHFAGIQLQRDQQQQEQQQQDAEGFPAAEGTMAMLAEFDAQLVCSSSSTGSNVTGNRSYSLAGLPPSLNTYHGWIICTMEKVCLSLSMPF